VDITRVSVSVFAGALNVGSESWDPAQIAAMGGPNSVPARGELRLHFAPRRSVPDERYFSSLTAELRVEAVDENGAATTATVPLKMRAA